MIRKAATIVCLELAAMTVAIGVISLGRTLFCGRSSPRTPWHIRFDDEPHLIACPGFIFRDGSVCWNSQDMASAAKRSPFGLGVVIKQWRGFVVFYVPAAVTGRGHLQLRFPLWVPFVLFSIYPTIAFVRGPYRRHRRRKKGLCLKCGYNLTGNVSGVCPECGKRI